ncbi:nuclear transport factor 2 family protein [Streptomyces sp. I05A-00742]|uniref:nuclear transport factor 2 family protein n=1 Tax=Streptomyces sp. I05A-00742 TaxID=2732853 RepID=UPI002896591C|nr:nuclear transport factor 2 family protein [Streptomyces sp. I05A-00742]
MTQPAVTAPAPTPVSGADYQEIQHFYARQMRLLDLGEAEAWAETFTEDGVFEQNVSPQPVRGRAAIATGMRAGLDRLAGTGLVRRHWIGMVAADVHEDGTVRSHYYATVFETTKGGTPQVHLSTTAEDVLVRRDGGGWLVAHRTVRHDGV